MTKTGYVKKQLADGRTITSWEMIQEVKATRLASIVFDINKELPPGAFITSTLESNNNCRFSKYKANDLAREFLAKGLADESRQV